MRIFKAVAGLELICNEPVRWTNLVDFWCTRPEVWEKMRYPKRVPVSTQPVITGSSETTESLRMVLNGKAAASQNF